MALPIFVVGGLVDYPAILVVKMQENLVRVVYNWTLFELAIVSIYIVLSYLYVSQCDHDDGSNPTDEVSCAQQNQVDGQHYFILI